MLVFSTGSNQINSLWARGRTCNTLGKASRGRIESREAQLASVDVSENGTLALTGPYFSLISSNAHEKFVVHL